LKVSTATPAKINLWLEVLGKRPDGYHEISTLMLPLKDVCDRVDVELKEAGFAVWCDHPMVPADDENIALKAARAYFEAADWTGGAYVRIVKNIPVAAGLGGGSSDAGAVLRLLNRLSTHPLPEPELRGLAARLGADVPFFIAPRPALATGIGEKLQPVEGLPEYPVLLVKPPVSVSTAWVYGRIKLTRGTRRIKIATLSAHPWDLTAVMENDLEPIAVEAFPVLGRIRGWLLGRAGVRGVRMSGSGPTVFAIFRSFEDAEKAGSEARNAWPECWVRVSRTCAASDFLSG
jgi:4-diphosphocytidyl-2-C-methyl-D-erythritol kinase